MNNFESNTCIFEDKFQNIIHCFFFLSYIIKEQLKEQSAREENNDKDVLKVTQLMY